jgi:predicted small integral membrane protein
METLRIIKAIMVATVGGWALLIAYDNMVDYGSNWAFVQHVLAMDTVFPDNALKSRAITDPALQKFAYWVIIATEGAMAIVCLWGAWRLFGARNDRRAFIVAKRPAAVGLLLVWLLYYVGFVIVGGEWFSMWQSKIWNGQAAAVDFLTCAMFVTIVLLLPEEDA